MENISKYRKYLNAIKAKLPRISISTDPLKDQITKILRYLIFILFLFAAAFFVRAWVMGNEIGLPFQVETNYETQPTLLNYFDIDGEPSGIYVDQLIAWQKYFTDDIIYDLDAHQMLFWLFVITLVFITAFISLLDRFNYLIAAGVICLMLTQLQIEELGLWEEYVSYIIIGLFLLVSYYFQAFRSATPWTSRLLVSFLAYGSLIAVFAFLSPALEKPIVAISQGIFGPIILSVLFVLYVAGENIFSLFKLATTAQPGKKGLIHFGFIGVIYLLICYLLFKEKNEGLSFDLYILGPELLMISSMISAYFSFDLRNHELEGSISDLLKTYLLPVGAAIFLMTYGFSIVTVNDSIKSALDWAIVIAHLCMGASYFVYALINFAPALLQGIPIWQAFYRGPRTAVLTIRMMGFILFIGGIFFLEYRPYYDAKAGQFNMLGDMAKHFNRPDVAKSYYEQAVFNDFYNLKANYSINQLAEKEFDKAEGKNRLENVFEHKANPIARMALANEYAEEERLFRTLSTLQEATAEERSSELQNNLGIAHYAYKNYDSAYNYFSNAQSEVNLEAIKFVLNDRLEYVPEKLSSNINRKVNQQALANLNDQALLFEFDIAPDTLINRADIFYLYNAALSRQEMDRDALIETLEAYINNPKNELFASFLYTAKAIAHYHKGEVNQAFQDIDLVISRTPNTAGFETFLKGIWYFNQGQPELTVEYVNLSQRRTFQNEQVKNFVEAVQNIKSYDQKADISTQLNSAQQLFEQEGILDEMVEVAQLNAFDAESTLSAISTLQSNDYDVNEVYELLLNATQINIKSAELLEAYIYQAQRLNLSSFADTALERLSGMIAYEDYFEVAKKLNAIREEQAIN